MLFFVFVQVCFFFSIKYWADELGEELWQLGQSLTRATDVKAVSSLCADLSLLNGNLLVVPNVFRKPPSVRPSVRYLLLGTKPFVGFFFMKFGMGVLYKDFTSTFLEN